MIRDRAVANFGARPGGVKAAANPIWRLAAAVLPALVAVAVLYVWR
jgi:hypothetical protein